MAHVAKIKAVAVAPMVDHYERRAELKRGYRRGNIDPERTAGNYNLRPHDVMADVGKAKAMHEQTAGRALRKDANVLFDWVVTLPKDCPAERARDFFTACAEFLEERYGRENLLGAYIHMDETTPHGHFPVLPMIGGKLQASKMINRQDLRTFHGDLNKAVDEALGFHVSVELDERQKAEKALSAVPHDKLAEATAELDSQIAEKADRLEYLQRRISEVEGQIADERNRVDSEDYAAQAFRGGKQDWELDEEAAQLECQVEAVERRASALDAPIAQLRRRVDELVNAIRDARAGRIAAIPARYVEMARERLQRARMHRREAMRSLEPRDVKPTNRSMGRAR